jgi:hypothetical protein
MIIQFNQKVERRDAVKNGAPSGAEISPAAGFLGRKRDERGSFWD